MLVQSWRDIRLSWDPSDFGGVHTLRTSANRIWLPDIRLYNASVQLPCFLLIARHNTDYGVWKGIKFCGVFILFSGDRYHGDGATDLREFLRFG